MSTFRIHLLCWVILPSLLMVISSERATGQIEFATVKREVAEAQARHLAQAESAQFDSSTEGYDELKNHNLDFKEQSRSRRSGQCYLVEQSVDLVPPKDVKVLVPPRSSSVVVYNSKYGFQLTRPGGPTEWRLKDVHILGSKDPVPRHLNPDSLAKRTLYILPYAAGPSTLTELFNAASFRLVGCNSSPSNPALVRIQFENSPLSVGKKPQTRLTGWCDIDPSAGWSVRAVEIESTDKVYRTTVRTDLKSTVDKDGLVLIDQLRHDVLVRQGDSIAAHRSDSTTYKIWVDREIPEREFTLTAYGLPEPPGISFAHPRPTYVWLLLGAAVFAVLAILFRWLTRRKPVLSTSTR